MVDDLSHGERVKASILAHGVALWRDRGEACVTARQIARGIGKTHAAVLYYFADAETMKAAIASEAMRLGDPVIVPQLIASRHPAASSLSVEDKRRFLGGC